MAGCALYSCRGRYGNRGEKFDAWRLVVNSFSAAKAFLDDYLGLFFINSGIPISRLSTLNLGKRDKMKGMNAVAFPNLLRVVVVRPGEWTSLADLMVWVEGTALVPDLRD